MNKLKHNGNECDIAFDTYSTGNIAIYLTHEGLPYATATINDPECPLEKNEVLIKDYSENKGMVAALKEAGIVKPLYPYPVGPFNAVAWVCKLEKQ